VIQSLDRGVSTRRVDELVQAMGLSGISKSQVSKLCKDIDERANAFLGHPIEGEWPYLWCPGRLVRTMSCAACGHLRSLPGRRSMRGVRA
jgi:transposase-like protein